MAVRRVKGVQKVDRNANEKTLTVHFDPEETAVQDLKEAMARVGYEAEAV